MARSSAMSDRDDFNLISKHPIHDDVGKTTEEDASRPVKVGRWPFRALGNRQDCSIERREKRG
jgi:hypothetical protein